MAYNFLRGDRDQPFLLPVVSMERPAPVRIFVDHPH
jgi:hypothetical protein